MFKKKADDLHCGFCGKAQNNVKKLIKGMEAIICNECVEICVEIIQEDKQPDAAANAEAKGIHVKK